MQITPIDHTQFMLNLGVAALLGALIGVERQWRQRLAGLRTNALVSIGSALFVMLSALLPNPGEATRMAAQVVTGIGFLGAGVIMHDGPSVRGLNTAATLWCSAAIGTLAGFGLFVEAFVGAAVVLGANIFLRPIAQRINRHPHPAEEQETRYQVRITCRDESESAIRYLILQNVGSSPLVLLSLKSADLPPNGVPKVEVIAKLDSHTRQDSLLEGMVGRLSLEKGVLSAAWEVWRGVDETT